MPLPTSAPASAPLPAPAHLAWRLAPLALSGALLLLAACASEPPPREQLAVSRAAVERAAGPSAAEAPGDVANARDKLQRANAAMAARLPFSDTADFEAAQRGLIAPVPGGTVRTAGGTVLWNLGEYAFIDGEPAPATVNPSLWRIARLNLANGLFKVTDRLYQLRGFDIANMTVIEGDSGLYDALIDLIEPIDSNFNIVTP